MVEIRQPMNPALAILPAMIFSIALHCILASVLFLCLRANSYTTDAPNVITVDIRTLETREEEREKTLRQPEQKAVHKKVPGPLPTAAEPEIKHPEQLPPEPLHPHSPDIEADTRETAAPAQMHGIVPANIVSVPVRPAVVSKQADISTHGAVSPPQHGTMGDANREKAYLDSLRVLIEEHKEYPLIARRGRMEGAVHVSCMIARSGKIMEASVVKSSGYTILDNAALRAVKATGRFPVVPAAIKGDTFSFVAPITFRLAAN